MFGYRDGFLNFLVFGVFGVFETNGYCRFGLIFVVLFLVCNLLFEI